MNYVKIQFINCWLDYDYTIVPFGEIKDYLDEVEGSFHQPNERPEDETSMVITPLYDFTEEDYGKFCESISRN